MWGNQVSDEQFIERMRKSKRQRLYAAVFMICFGVPLTVYGFVLDAKFRDSVMGIVDMSDQNDQWTPDESAPEEVRTAYYTGHSQGYHEGERMGYTWGVIRGRVQVMLFTGGLSLLVTGLVMLWPDRRVRLLLQVWDQQYAPDEKKTESRIPPIR